MRCTLNSRALPHGRLEWRILLKKTHILIVALGALQVALGASIAPTRAVADSTCSNSCKAAYGSCYKSSQDRARCQSQLQRCLEQCIRKKR